MIKKYFIYLLTAIESLFQFCNAQSWQPMNGPIGTDIISSFITKEKGEIFAFTATQKIFISSDKGATWTEYSIGLQKIFILHKWTTYHVKFKESQSGDIYFSNSSHLYKFNNINKIWELKLKGENIEEFEISPDETYIYVAANDKMLISKNNGTYIKVSSWWSDAAELLCIGNNNNFVRTTDGWTSELWKFNDDGTQLKKILTTSCCQKLFYHKKNNAIYDINKTGFQYSTDFGTTWQSKNFQNSIYLSNFIELNDGSLLSYFAGNFYRSQDNGANWTLSSEYSNGKNIINYFNYNDQLSISKDGGIIASNHIYTTFTEPNKKTFILNLPLTEASIVEVNTLSNNDCYVSLNSGTQISKDDGKTWNKIEGLFRNNYIAWNDGTIGIPNFSRDSIYFTNNLGKTGIYKKLPEKTNGILIDCNENLLVYTYDSIYLSNNKADNWITTGHIDFITPDLKISKQNILYRIIDDLDNITYSTDYGVRWNSFQIDDQFTPLDLYLTANNVFYWIIEMGGNFVLKYTHDFGQTINSYNIPFDNKLLLIDDYDNLYFKTNSLTELKVLKLFNNKESTLSLQGLDLTNQENLYLHQGKNDYLYANKDYSPLFKFSEKLENTFSTFRSSIYIDQNDDCKIKNAESLAKSIQLELKGKNNFYSLSSLYDGKYLAFVSPDTYEIKIKDRNSIWELCNFPKQLQVLPNQNVVLDSLVIKPKINCVDLITGLSLSRLRRCFDGNQAYISIRNEGTIDTKDTKLQIILDDYFTDITCNVNPSSQVGNLWTFDVPRIKVGETFRITFTFKVSCTASLNQEHCIKGIIVEQNHCPSQLPDTLIHCEKNIGSFDPNDKMVYINGIQSPTFHKTDSVLEYLIRFQNTGTDTAFTVVIKDQLDYNLDWSSLTPISASHDYSYFLNDDGTMEIKFANIQLPDSSINYTASNGYFKYNIKPKRDLNFGTKIFNDASIYFDFNEPVITNLTQIQLVPILGTKEVKPQETIQLTAIPNPFTESCTLVLPDHWKNKNLQYHIASSEGKHHTSHFTKAMDITIPRDELEAGIYFVYLIDDRGNRAYCRVVVQ